MRESGFKALSLHVPEDKRPCSVLKHLGEAAGGWGFAVLTATPSQPPLCCYQRRSGGPGQRVKPGTPEAKGQVRGLGEKGQKYAFRFPRAPAAQLPSTGSLVDRGTIAGTPTAAPQRSAGAPGGEPRLIKAQWLSGPCDSGTRTCLSWAPGVESSPKRLQRSPADRGPLWPHLPLHFPASCFLHQQPLQRLRGAGCG